MKNKLMVLFGLGLTLLAPVAVFAQGVSTSGSSTSGCNMTQSGTLLDIFCRIGQILNSIVPILIALAVVYFVWGVVSFVIANDEEAKTKGRDRIIFGIIGLAVIIGMWGLVNVLRNTFGLNNTTNITLPTIPTNINN